MKNMLIVIVLLMTSTQLYATQTQLTIVGGLSEEQEAKLILDAAKMAAENKTAEAEAEAVAAISSIPTLDVQAKDVKEWAQLIDIVGDGMLNIATKTGMAVNDFAGSGVGIFMMVLIAWSYMGADLMGFVFASLWFMITLPGWFYCYRRLFVFSKITYYDKESPGGKRKEIEFSDGDSPTDITAMMYWVVLAVIALIGFVAAFN